MIVPHSYPWWPSIVCPHPTSNTYVKRKGKTVFIHVQFFDDPVSRAWIKERDLKEYLGKHKSDVPLLKDAKWNQSIEFADQALKMEVDERWTLIAELIPSDEEDGIVLIDDETNNQSFETSNTSLNNSSNDNKETPKSKTDKKEEKSGHKSDLKRKNSQKDVENNDRKKFKSVSLDLSENDSNDSEDEFKIESNEDSDDSDEEIKEISEEELESLEELDSSDSEPKAKRKSKSSKSKHKKSSKKSKKKSSQTKGKKSSKKSKRSYSSESEDMSEPSDMYSSDSETSSKAKSSSKSSSKWQQFLNTSETKSKKKSVVSKASDSEVMSVDSDSDSQKPKKVESSTPKTTSKNWLTERTNSHKKNEKKSLKTPRTTSKTNKSLFSMPDESFRSVTDFSENSGDKEWPHLLFPFLQVDKIKDKNGRFRLVNGQLNPDYDPTTLTVPQSFLEDCTPALRQWWVFKSNNFDTILFFKMGKFYELFHMDAVIAVNELQIQYMRGELAHAGFPEKAYKRYADVLIQKNYKVARIEQTETPQMMEERVKKIKKPTKFHRVVNREMCRVSTIGTRMMSVIDPDSLTDRTSHLLAITENVNIFIFFC